MKVFIAGPRTIRKLDSMVEERLCNIMQKEIDILVGDADGVDKLVQQYLSPKGYERVSVYASEGKTRNNLGNWPIEAVPVGKNTRGFAFYAAKDLQMAEDADYGFMIWNGKSKGTLNNILNLLVKDKKVLVFFVPHRKFYSLDSLEDARQLVSACDEETRCMFQELSFSKSEWRSNEQMGILLEKAN